MTCFGRDWTHQIRSVIQGVAQGKSADHRRPSQVKRSLVVQYLLVDRTVFSGRVEAIQSSVALTPGQWITHCQMIAGAQVPHR
jgi:hypothetical protein